MALRAVDGDPHIDRSAPADLHHVAKPVDRGRLANQAQVRDDILLGHIVHQRDRAEPRRSFLVAGDDQADRAEICGKLVQGADESSDAALHVDGAAPVQQIAAHFRDEGVGLPALAGRYDIEMSGIGEMARAGRSLADREKIFDGAVRCLAGDEARDGKIQRCQNRFHFVKYAAGGGGNAGLCDQTLGELESGRCGHWPGLRLQPLPAVPAVRSPMVLPRPPPSIARSTRGRESSAYSWWQSRAGGTRKSGSETPPVHT